MTFWKVKTKIRNSDRLFSKYIRLRDGGCAYKFKCNGNCKFEDLTCSHFIKRRKESVRFDPLNCDAACKKCHYFVEVGENGDDEGNGYVSGQKFLAEWKKKQLGEVEYKKLLIRANTIKKRDDYLDTIYVKELLKTL